MNPALRHPNGPAFDTNALQGFSCSGPVGRLCQAAREAGSKGEVLGPVSGKNARPRRAHPISSDVRTSEALGGALVRNMHAEFPRLSPIRFSKGYFTGWMRFSHPGRSPHGCSVQPHSCGCGRCGEDGHTFAGLLLPRQKCRGSKPDPTRFHEEPLFICSTKTCRRSWNEPIPDPLMRSLFSRHPNRCFHPPARIGGREERERE
jgi:hypothetical protein